MDTRAPLVRASTFCSARFRSSLRTPPGLRRTRPEAIVQKQLEAYNSRDIEAFTSAYSGDVQIFEHPAKLLARGTEQLRQRYSERFKDPKLHAVILKRIVMGNLVVDHERVTRTFAEGTGTADAVAIYEVEAGKINKVWLIPGPRRSTQSVGTR